MADYMRSPNASTISPFSQVVTHLREKLVRSVEYKNKHFDRDAQEARMFLKGGEDLHKHLYKSSGSGGDFTVNADLRPPDFLMSTNRVAEMKDLFNPHLYHKNPFRQANPRTRPEMPQELFFQPMPPQMLQQMVMQMQMQQMMQPQMQPGMMPPDQTQGQPPEQQMSPEQMVQQQYQQMQQQQYDKYLQELNSGNAVDRARSTLAQAYLNYTPTPLKLRDEMRMCIDEALIAGLGIMVTETYRPPGSNKLMVGSFWDSVDNHVIDPDMEKIDLALMWWRRRIRPVWQVEDQYTIPYGFPRGYLKGNASSMNQQSANSSGAYGIEPFRVKEGQTNDLLVTWECWSKMGLGQKLSGVPTEMRAQLDQFGDNVLMVICDTCPVPINFLGARDGQDLQKRMRWPTPFWRDDSWPFTEFQFHPQSRCVYPYSHVKPAMGELKFLNWCYSFLAGKVRTISRDFIVTLKQAADSLKRVLLHGGDLSHIDIQQSDGSFKISDVVQWLQHPNMNSDIFTVLDRIESQFERRTGMTALLYGEAGTQSRLASDADFRQARSMVRIEDMADNVEVGATDTARKEALAAAFHLDPQRDIAPVLGHQAANYWAQVVNFEDMLHSQEFRIEAGSIRKPNRERDANNAVQMLQTVGPIFQAHSQATGQYGPLNAAVQLWLKTQDVEGASAFNLEPPPPPEGPSPEEMEMQMEQQRMQSEMDMEQQRLGMEQQQMQMQAQIEMQQAEVEAQAKQMDLVAKQQELQFDVIRSQQELTQDQQAAQQEMQQARERFNQEIAQMRARNQVELQIQRDKQAMAKQAAQEKIKQQKAQANKPKKAKA